ncbi:hypothetical protein HO133_011020 [Letharia lupina]|uniref:Uncharacterized protein n=1 Tax=Letharia lupina TaxID=560253 RepID=A0A8H6CJ03_9LECA|nr:uncharacterized protein HO133_011020 [Letharia lupina]KAF6224443.1 hypothetical protein HO133_011020 [Letharia lupina]
MELSRPPNPHIAEPLLHPFLSPTFSPTAYLNDTLPTTTSKPTPTLSSIATQTQTQISALAAQTTRLSTTLTSLTDDILRTSSRLAYEVELLRGEALSLADSLSSSGRLDEAIRGFVPKGLDAASSPTDVPSSPARTRHGSQPASPSAPRKPSLPSDPSKREPEALPHLRIFLQVRSSLQTVIQRFNLALSFPMPPSLLATTTSSLISVSAPNVDPDLESKGQAALARFKQEVLEMLERGDLATAKARVQELRDVCEIWKGTSEERARGKWLDGLEAVVEDREGRGKASGRPMLEKREGSAVRGVETSASGAGPGFLRRLRDEIYME